MGTERRRFVDVAAPYDARCRRVWLAAGLAAVSLLSSYARVAAGYQVTVDEEVAAVFSQISLEEWEQLGIDPAPTTRFMTQLANVDDATLARWESAANASSEAGQRFRVGDCVRLKGRVSSVTRLLPAARAGELPDYQRTRAIEMVAADGATITLLANQVPAEFFRKPRVASEPVRCVGIVLRATDREIVVGTNRVGWFPESDADASPSPAGLAGRQLLADLGIDVGILDPDYVALDPAQVESLRYAELVGAVELLGEASRGEAVDAALAPFDLVTLVQHHRRQQGALMKVEGEVRRITPIRGKPNGVGASGAFSTDAITVGGNTSSDEVIWYQLDVFVPLGNKRIALASQNDGEPISITGSYGVTLLLPALPDGLAEADLPVSIACPGLFWKLWRHSIETEASTEYRPNPVLFGLGNRLQIVEQRVSRVGFLRGIGLFWALLVCLGVAFAVSHWRRNRNRKLPNKEEVLDTRRLNDDLSKLIDSPESERYP